LKKGIINAVEENFVMDMFAFSVKVLLRHASLQFLYCDAPFLGFFFSLFTLLFLTLGFSLLFKRQV